MFDKLKAVEIRFEEVGQLLSDPAVISDNEQFKKLMKEHKELTPIVEKYREYAAAKSAEQEANELLEAGGLDKDFKELVDCFEKLSVAGCLSERQKKYYEDFITKCREEMKGYTHKDQKPFWT